MGGMMGGMGMGGMGGMPRRAGGPRTRRRAREQPDVMPDGTRVLVRGLAGAAQHNGKGGEVRGFDDSSLRYTVGLLLVEMCDGKASVFDWGLHAVLDRVAPGRKRPCLVGEHWGAPVFG